MISMYKWQKMKAMSVQGKGIKTIARELKMLIKNTVRKYLKDTTVPIFHPRTYPHLLDKYQALIASFVEKHCIGTRIDTGLKKLGYTGSLFHRSPLSRYPQKRAKAESKYHHSCGNVSRKIDVPRLSRMDSSRRRYSNKNLFPSGDLFL